MLKIGTAKVSEIPETNMTMIITPTSDAQLDQVRQMMRAFIAWHRQRHLEDIHLIDQYFDSAAFEEELALLPGKYSPPRGRLLLAVHDSEPAGCVALREIDALSCEMKRMFVYPHLHGNSIGLALARAIIREAREIGYRSMLLDTSVRQEEAKNLYQRLGFKTIEPYYELPDELRDWLAFMELKL